MGAEKTPGSAHDQPPRETEVQPANEHYQERTAEAAAKAHAKRDSFHLTKKGTLRDQKEFEKAQRIHDRALGVVEGSMYSPRHVMNREANERENQIRANEMNERRGILDRLLGRNKMTSHDVLRDEADRMNAATDHRVMEEGGAMHPQDAHDEIAQSKEFLPDTYSEFWETHDQQGRADLLARMRSADPYIELALNSGDAEPLRAFALKEIDKAGTQEEASVLRIAFMNIVSQKLDTFIRTRDTASALNLLSNKNAYIPLSEELIRAIPDEMLQYKEIRAALRERMPGLGKDSADALREVLGKKEQKQA